MANQIQRMDVQIAPPALGFCPTNLAAIYADLATKMVVTPAFGFYGINYGPTPPTDTDIPWFNTTQNDWYYYSTVAGDWLPVRPVSITGEVQIGSFMFWDGQISLISQVWGDKWLFANGQLVSRTEYSDYFAMIGTKWNAGDGSTTFGILDMTNCFGVGADADVAGQANTTVSDGATPTIQRAYLDHFHQLNGTPNDTITGGGANSIGGALGLPPMGTPIRVLPPYKSLVPIVRVK